MYDFDTLKELNKRAVVKAENEYLARQLLDLEEVREAFGDKFADHLIGLRANGCD